ncbi:hypothetical protein MCOR27_010269 [Pyricularia oryzae]|uniref:Uncharacterized protein n=1 Tax=Pyricularia oryzae TaxID=318829 RepID=A0A4P7MYA4_PYROR|nr:hypothetical protein MCOR01_006235 [Pyricularia oryzae]KAI6268188.1 hypothetical protein MCOR27_010269 [Pyricularia oryzae]KAI6299744.1 hypothetical protein MCOR29_011000 [Pyricularia oryzae]KAI6356649.1 hypothetical protein MCOR31_010611 [Pyricularia oryzae]KAI6416932.1 hypothetical protein MCOR21_011179 [Pyricularia oryzae]
MPGDFSIQPVSRAVPCTELPPIMVRTEDYSDSGVNSVFAMCVLLDEDGNMVEDVDDPATGNPMQSFYSNSPSGLQCNTSVPTANSELSSSSGSGSRLLGSIYFTFTGLNVTCSAPNVQSRQSNSQGYFTIPGNVAQEYKRANRSPRFYSSGLVHSSWRKTLKFHRL